MVNSREDENMVQSEQLKEKQEQLTDLAITFAKHGKMDKALELVRKIISIDNQRIIELSKMNANSSTHKIIMKELNELYWLYKGE